MFMAGFPMAADMRHPSRTELTDDQGAIWQPLLPPAKPGGRPQAVDRREVLNTRLYLNRTGGPWAMLPHDLFSQRTVYADCSPGRHEGTWQPMVDALRAAVGMQQAPANATTPSAASRESPSVKTTEPGGERGDDGGKNIHGRQRPKSVEVLGRRLAVVSRAALDDAVAAPWGLQPLEPTTDPRVAVIGADNQDHHPALNAWIDTAAPGQWRLESVRRPAGSTGVIL
jgi:putative transposase